MNRIKKLKEICKLINSVVLYTVTLRYAITFSICYYSPIFRYELNQYFSKFQKNHYNKLYKKIIKKYKHSLVYNLKDYDPIISSFSYPNQPEMIDCVLPVYGPNGFSFEHSCLVNIDIITKYEFIVIYDNNKYILFFKNKNKFLKFKMRYG